MITDRLLHIHIYRTGGFLVRAVLQEIPGLRIHNDQLHMTYDQMVEKCNGEVPPAIAFIRNPYSWYVSMWGRIWWDDKVPFEGSFRDYMEGIGEIDDPNFVTLSDHWQEMGGDKADYRGMFEHLKVSICGTLSGCLGDLANGDDDYVITDPALYYEYGILPDLIEKQPIFHPSTEWPTGKRITDYRQYYDDELRGWVEEWDGEMIERFGYKFD